jgi:HD-GYP domain-containing protein (c-di-GMP phosphodiesterase class II)
MRTAPVGSLDTLLETLDLRRPAVAAHSRRVAAYARQLAIVVGLDDIELVALEQAALIHDAGSLVGRSMGSTIDMVGLGAWCGLAEGVTDILWYAVRRFDHHRHAPLAARLLAVAHAYDDLTAAREYHVPLQPDTAKMAIAREAGRRYCPIGVTALMTLSLERLDDGSERAVADVRTDGRADIDASRVDAAGWWRVDYRFVTTS